MGALDDHILPELGDLRLDKIHHEIIEEWRDSKKADGYAAATVNGYLALLRSILGKAVRVERLPYNAALEVRPLPLDDVRITDDEPNALTSEELRKFLEVARRRQPRHYAMILVLVTTGMRMSNARALRWEDIDEERGVIYVRRRASAKEVVPGVKRSRTGRDVVPLLPELAEALRKQRIRLTKVQTESGWIFPTEDGKVRPSTVLRKPFNDIRKHAGITKRFTPHGCRRTANDLYRQASSDVVTKAITGHLTQRMHEHYSTVSHGEKLEAARRAFHGLVPEVPGAKTGDRAGDRKN